MAKIIGTTQCETYKPALVERKKKHTIISKIPWCNVLQRAGTDYCVNDNFPGTFSNFDLKILTKEKISSFGNPCP